MYILNVKYRYNFNNTKQHETLNSGSICVLYSHVLFDANISYFVIWQLYPTDIPNTLSLFQFEFQIASTSGT